MTLHFQENFSSLPVFYVLSSSTNFFFFQMKGTFSENHFYTCNIHEDNSEVFLSVLSIIHDNNFSHELLLLPNLSQWGFKHRSVGQIPSKQHRKCLPVPFKDSSLLKTLDTIFPSFLFFGTDLTRNDETLFFLNIRFLNL